MSHADIVIANGVIVGVHSWTEGFRALKCPKKALTEDDVLAVALWLEKRGMQDEALALIERFVEYHRLQ